MIVILAEQFILYVKENFIQMHAKFYKNVALIFHQYIGKFYHKKM